MDRGTRTVWTGLCPGCQERILVPEVQEEKVRRAVAAACKCGLLVDLQKVTFTGEALTPQVRDFHHLWCNGRSDSPVLGCRWCCHQDAEGNWKGLWIDYPYDPLTTSGLQLMKQHFPRNILRTA